MKKILFTIALALIVAVSLNPADAAAFRILPAANGPYATDNLSTTAKLNFDISETPFIYLEFDKSFLNTSQPLYVSWLWQHESDAAPSSFVSELFPTSSASDPLQIWKTADNWSSIKKTGDWTVQTLWTNPSIGSGKGGFGAGQASVTVTPEPVSTVLFLFGGAPIAAAIYRKRKKA